MIGTKFLYSILLAVTVGGLNISNALAVLPDYPMSKEMTASKSAYTVARMRLPELNMQALRNPVAKSMAQPGPLEFAALYATSNNVDNSGTWQQLSFQSEEVMVWRYQIESPNAYSINLGFSNYAMPEGGHMFIYGDDYQHLLGPFTAEHNEVHGELWTPVFNTNRITIEVNVPAASKGELQLALDSINQGFLDFDNINQDLQSLKSGSCNVDVACPVSTGWGDQIRSVARYTISGRFLCTGTAINNTSRDRTPFFLTANHCGVNTVNDASIVAYWNYQNSSCRPAGSTASGNSGNGGLSQYNMGAFVRAQYPASDMELIEFEEKVLPEANVFFAGWDRRDIAPINAVAIHHPAGDEKRISFENDPLSISAYLNPPGSGTTHLRVADWDIGTTESGSSGSPIFNSNKHVVGALHGGFAACGNNLPDWYGRFAVSWLGGGTSSRQLKSFLDPTSTGALTLDGINDLVADSFEDDSNFGIAKPIISGISQTHTIHVRNDIDWVGFSIPETADIEVEVQASEGEEISVVLYSFVPGNFPNAVQPFQAGNYVQVRADSQSAGMYLIKVAEARNIEPVDSYVITMNAFYPDSFESDNDSSSATVTQLGEEQTHSIFPAGDEDWVQFTLDQETEISISTLGTAGDTQIELFDQHLSSLEFDDNSGSGLLSRIAGRYPTGLYYLKVTEKDAGEIAQYKLLLRQEEIFLLQLIPAIISANKSR